MTSLNVRDSFNIDSLLKDLQEITVSTPIKNTVTPKSGTVSLAYQETSSSSSFRSRSTTTTSHFPQPRYENISHQQLNSPIYQASHSNQFEHDIYGHPLQYLPHPPREVKSPSLHNPKNKFAVIPDHHSPSSGNSPDQRYMSATATTTSTTQQQQTQAQAAEQNLDNWLAELTPTPRIPPPQLQSQQQQGAVFSPSQPFITLAGSQSSPHLTFSPEVALKSSQAMFQSYGLATSLTFGNDQAAVAEQPSSKSRQPTQQPQQKSKQQQQQQPDEDILSTSWDDPPSLSSSFGQRQQQQQQQRSVSNSNSNNSGRFPLSNSSSSQHNSSSLLPSTHHGSNNSSNNNSSSNVPSLFSQQQLNNNNNNNNNDNNNNTSSQRGVDSGSSSLIPPIRNSNHTSQQQQQHQHVSSSSASTSSSLATIPSITANNNSGNTSSSSNSSTKARCSRVTLAGSHLPRGYKASSFSKMACDCLLCTQCNFKVIYFLSSRWDESIDYMFVRNNMPNVDKLAARLLRNTGSNTAAAVAYCCQCHWTTEDGERNLSATNTGLNGEVPWICAGHNI